MSNSVEFYRLESTDVRPKEDGAISFGIDTNNHGKLYVSTGEQDHLIGEALDRLSVSTNSEGFSETHGIAVGKNIKVGRKGFYYNCIDFTNKKIYLTDKQPSFTELTTSGGIVRTDLTVDYQLSTEDEDSASMFPPLFSLVNNNKHENCARIESIENNVVTYSGTLPFSSFIDASEGGKYDLDNDDYSFTVVSQPHVGPCVIKDLGIASGAGNISAGNENFVSGRANIVYGDYAFGAGYSNEVDYCSGAIGRDNNIYAHQSFGTGLENKIESGAVQSFIANRGNTIKTGTRAAVFGYKNTVDAGNGTVNTEHNVLVAGYKNTVNSVKSSIISGSSNVVTSEGQAGNPVDNSFITGNGHNIKGGSNILVSGKGHKLNNETGGYAWPGAQSIVGGLNNELGKNSVNALVVGRNNTADGQNQTVLGCYNVSSTSDLLIIGNGSTSKKSNGLVVNNTGTTAIAGSLFLNKATASYDTTKLKNSVVLGDKIQDTDKINTFAAVKATDQAIIAGKKITLENGDYAGSQSLIFGEGHKVRASKNLMMGNDIEGTTNATRCAGIGNTLKLAGADQLVVGQYNVADAGKRFIVGRGSSSSSPKNVFTVDDNGNVVTTGKVAALTISTNSIEVTGHYLGKKYPIKPISFSPWDGASPTRISWIYYKIDNLDVYLGGLLEPDQYVEMLIRIHIGEFEGTLKVKHIPGDATYYEWGTEFDLAFDTLPENGYYKNITFTKSVTDTNEWLTRTIAWTSYGYFANLYPSYYEVIYAKYI